MKRANRLANLWMKNCTPNCRVKLNTLRGYTENITNNTFVITKYIKNLLIT